MSGRYSNLFSTYSIIAADLENGQMGGAVQTHQMGVGRIIPQAVPGVGVVASQSLSNVSFNNMALAMLREGVEPERIVAALVASDAGHHRRQVGVLNTHGQAAAYTGSGCIREAAHHVGDGYSIHANMMTKTTVIDAMREAYEGAQGDLAARMMTALQAAQAEDGDIRGMQSSALKVVPLRVDAQDWQTIYDLRVDEHDDPVTELGRLARIRRAQLINNQGHNALDAGDVTTALEAWKQARELAPEQEELAFWQAVALADVKPHEQAVKAAAAIFKEGVIGDARQEHWLELVGRLQECGLIQREGAAKELLEAIAVEG